VKQLVFPAFGLWHKTTDDVMTTTKALSSSSFFSSQSGVVVFIPSERFLSKNVIKDLHKNHYPV